MTSLNLGTLFLSRQPWTPHLRL